jgi:hypothetical protein
MTRNNNKEQGMRDAQPIHEVKTRKRNSVNRNRSNHNGKTERLDQFKRDKHRDWHHEIMCADEVFLDSERETLQGVARNFERWR